jgi:hypothetical protein
MSDMVDCGRVTFEQWAGGSAYSVRWLGEFNPDMAAEDALEKMDMRKLTIDAQQRFMRGWKQAQSDHVRCPGTGDLFGGDQ